MVKTFKAIEALAKLEQRNCMRKGKFVGLFNTRAVGSLSDCDRKDFFSYMRTRKRKTKFLLLIPLIALVAAIIFSHSITGSVITSSSFVGNGLSFLFILVFIFSLGTLVWLRGKEKMLQERFNRHISVAEKYLAR